MDTMKHKRDSPLRLLCLTSRLPVVCESMLAKEEAFVAQSDISTDVPIPVRPLSGRLIGSVDDAAWARCPNLSSLTQNVSAIPRLPSKQKQR